MEDENVEVVETLFDKQLTRLLVFTGRGGQFRVLKLKFFYVAVVDVSTYQCHVIQFFLNIFAPDNVSVCAGRSDSDENGDMICQSKLTIKALTFGVIFLTGF